MSDMTEVPGLGGVVEVMPIEQRQRYKAMMGMLLSIMNQFDASSLDGLVVCRAAIALSDHARANGAFMRQQDFESFLDNVLDDLYVEYDVKSDASNPTVRKLNDSKITKKEKDDVTVQ